MKRVLVLAVALLLLAAALPAPAAAMPCRDVIDTGPTGFDPADSDGVRTKDVGCRLARRLAAKAGLVAVSSVFWVLRNAERRCPGTAYIADPGITVRFWVQGVSCRRGPYPPAWRNAGRDRFDGRHHVVRDRPRARIAYG